MCKQSEEVVKKKKELNGVPTVQPPHENSRCTLASRKYVVMNLMDAHINTMQLE